MVVARNQQEWVSESFWEGFPDPRSQEVRDLWTEVRQGSVSALRQVERLAGDGSPLAMVYIAGSLACGETYKSADLEKALAWYRAAASYGIAQAYHGAGSVLMQLGRSDEAVLEYERAIALGFSPSMERLARRYFQGDGVSVDRAAAERLWQLGAKAGNLWAKRNLARARAAGAYGLLNRLRGCASLLLLAFEIPAMAATGPMNRFG